MNSLARYQLTTPFVLSFCLTVLILLLPKFLPSKLPLFYSLPWGEAQLTNQNKFFIIPVACLTIHIVNILVYRQLHPQQIMLKQILSLTSLLCSLILTLTFLKIITTFI